MDNNKIIQQWISNLETNGIDSSILESDVYDFQQKFVVYRATRLGLILDDILNPNIPAIEMENMVDEYIMDIKNITKTLALDIDKYTFAQIRELNDAIFKGFDTSLYNSYQYSAQHMYVAKTFQQEGLLGLENLNPQTSLVELLQMRDNERIIKYNNYNLSQFIDSASVLNYFEKINPELVEQIKIDGKLEVKGINGGTVYLSDNEPQYLANLLQKATCYELVEPIIEMQSEYTNNYSR
jgi:hypothetical protein